MHFDLIRCLGLGPVSFGENLILEAGGEGEHVFALAVFGEECFTEGLILLRELFGLGALFLFELGEECLDFGFGLVDGHLGLAAVENRGYCVREILDVDFVDA